MWNIQHAVALQAVFTALNESGVEWMVLRNYEGLPAINRSKDIDLICAKNNFSRARQIISESLKSQHFDHYEHTLFQCIWCFTFFNAFEVPPISIKIDLLDGFVWRGAQVVGFDDLYARKIRHADFYVPDPVYDGFMLWIKPLMTGGIIKDKYRDDISRSLDESPRGFQTLLEDTFGTELAGKIWPLLERRDLNATILFQRRLCHAAWFVSFRRAPLRTIMDSVEHMYLEVVRRSFRHRGSMVAVIGPDGAGKSTFIDFFQKELSRCFVKETGDVIVQHFRPNILPNLKKLLCGKKYDDTKEEFTSPHRAKPAGFFSSLLRISYYWLDYLFGYWLHIHPRCVAGSIYIFDRYFYDFIVDPYRSRINLPQCVRRLFLKFTPEPDIVFFLNCDAGTIYERKQELSLPEIERQLSAYRALAKQTDRFVTLDALKAPTDLCNDALKRFIISTFHPL